MDNIDLGRIIEFLIAILGGGAGFWTWLSSRKKESAEARKANAEAKKVESEKDKLELESAASAIKIREDTNRHLEERLAASRKTEIEARESAAEAWRRVKIAEAQSQEWKSQYQAQVEENRRMFAAQNEMKRTLDSLKGDFQKVCTQNDTLRSANTELARLLAECESRLPTKPLKPAAL